MHSLPVLYWLQLCLRDISLVKSLCLLAWWPLFLPWAFSFTVLLWCNSYNLIKISKSKSLRIQNTRLFYIICIVCYNFDVVMWEESNLVIVVTVNYISTPPFWICNMLTLILFFAYQIFDLQYKSYLLSQNLALVLCCYMNTRQFLIWLDLKINLRITNWKICFSFP